MKRKRRHLTADYKARVAAWFNRQGKTSPLTNYKVTGTTDANGMVEIEGGTIYY